MGSSQFRVGVVVRDGYQELEFWCPVLRAREAEASVTVIGADGGDAHLSALGYPVVPDKALAEAAPDDFDLVVVPGAGNAAEQEALSAFLAKAKAAGAVLAAISAGVSALAAAGLLEGRFAGHGLVSDGRVILAGSADDLPAFCRAVVQAAPALQS